MWVISDTVYVIKKEMKNVKISAVLITLNEARIIERALDAISWCDEILIVDSGSTDHTTGLCKDRGCRVLYHPFQGYGKQKRFAVSQATHDWILAIDADEVVTVELREEIVNALSNNANYAGFYLPRTLVFLGREFSHGSECKRPILRLFNRKYGNFSDVPVHEGVELRGSAKTLRGTLLHYSYRDVAHYLSKFNTYTSLAAKQLYDRGKTTHQITIVLRLPIRFLHFYLLKGNFLNGFPGFVWSLLSGFYPVVKYLKLYELSQQRSDP